MLRLLFLLLLGITLPLSAQLVTTVPSAPTDDRPVTITFDATQGTAGLADCGCDVYLHTGVVTNTSSEWQYVVTTWAEANDEWKMTPVPGETNKYTYSYTPSVREYFNVPEGETIERIAIVFRNADGSLEGKATGNNDVFINVSEGGGGLGITATGNPEQEFWALGRPLAVRLGATVTADLKIFDNDTLVAEGEGTDLATDIVFTTPGEHVVRFQATTEDGQVEESTFTINARLELAITSPSRTLNEASTGSQVTISGTSYIAADLTIDDGEQELYASSGTPDFSETLTLGSGSVMTLTVTATLHGDTTSKRLTFVTAGPEPGELPADFTPGATLLGESTVRLGLRAPGKSDVFVLHNLNGFTPTAKTRMKRSADGDFFIDLADLPVGVDLLYQYLIDGVLIEADPYSRLVLDPFNDRFVPQEVFAGIPDYPSELTEGHVSWLRRDAPAYEWKSEEDYGQPDPAKMVIYELLVRDFLEDHSFKSLTDTIDYLARLGVNAIELMPINEFEGNLSWGYNPSYHMALDKYYGTPEALKAFIDACHQRGMAVIVDVVYNHAFGQSPLARMWWDTTANRPAVDNPYFNPVPRHDFNVGNDFNHESALTQEYVKVTTGYWLEEFRIDGFRWDLTKGFTQNNTLGNEPAWNAYDSARVATLKDYADHVWSVNEDAYMILEHLAVVDEEEALATYRNGMYFWSGFVPHDRYLEASMGYHEDGKSNFRDAIAGNRGFSGNTLIAYMESHDEERMQYKNEQFGNRAGAYDVRDPATGLKRVELASTFFYTLPGPKMLWQFGELGYDFSINYCIDDPAANDCRTGNKPVRWNYREDPNRQNVYNWIADLNYLRNNYDILHGEVQDENFGGALKSFSVTGSEGTAIVVGNFDIRASEVRNVFPTTGTWYDYASGRELEVSSTDQAVMLEAGEYGVYLSQAIEPGGGSIGTATNDRVITRLALDVLPNPTDGPLIVSFSLPSAWQLRIDLLDLNGRVIRKLYDGYTPAGSTQMALSTLSAPAGMYLLRVTDGLGSGVKKIVVR